MMAISPPPNPSSPEPALHGPLDVDLVPLPQLDPPVKSDIKISLPDSSDIASTVPNVGSPMSPATQDVLSADLPVSTLAPNGDSLVDTPPLNPPSSTTVLKDNAMAVDTASPTTAPQNGVNGHHGDPDIELDTPTLPESRQREESADDLLPPAKRPRTTSDPDPSSLIHGTRSSRNSPLPEAPPPSATPSPPSVPSSSSGLPPAQHRFCLMSVRYLKKLKDASPFLRPVDPIALNVPHYFQVITHPMDLSTVEDKLLNSRPDSQFNPEKGRYSSSEEFMADVRLVFANCYTFNGEEHAISQMAKRLSAMFDKQMKALPAVDKIPPMKKQVKSEQINHPPPPPAPPVVPPPPTTSVAPSIPAKKAVRRPSTSVPTIRRSDGDQPGRPKREIHPPAPKDLPYADLPRKTKRVKGRKDDGTQDQLRFCNKLLQDLLRKQYYEVAYPFYDPVDWVKLEIPSYPKIIKRPMDLSTMRKKLDAGDYHNSQKFYDDFKLMIRNCFTFNPEGTPVNQAGVELQKVFDDKWRHLPPLREAADESEEEEEEDSEDEQAKAVAAMETQIEVLRGNLAAMKKRPKKEKKEKRKDKNTSSSNYGNVAKNAGTKSSNKKKNRRGDDDTLSFEQKKDLSETIATLDGPKLERVIQIIHEGVPEIRDSTEEIELDIDSLPPTVLTKLYNFVLRPIRAPPKRSRGVGGGTGGLKRKSMDEDVEAERIRQLEQRIALFNNTSGTPATANIAHDSGQSSDDSSDDSSGSDSE